MTLVILVLVLGGVYWAISEVREGFKSVLGSTYIVHFCSLVPSILIFDFDLVIFSFWGPNGLFWGRGWAKKLFWRLLMYLNHIYFLCFRDKRESQKSLGLDNFC